MLSAICEHLLFLLCILVGLCLCTLCAHSSVSGLAASVAQFAVCLFLARVVRHFALCDDDLVGDWHADVAVLDLSEMACEFAGCLDFSLGRIALLWLLGVAWEQHQSLAVGFQTVDVGGEGFFGQVLAARVD